MINQLKNKKMLLVKFGILTISVVVVFGIIQNPFELADKLENKAGIVEHGLFLRMATKVIVADEKGIRILER